MNEPRTKLICLHHAGGTPSVFHPWTDLSPEGVEVVPVGLPSSPRNGRRRRYRDAESLVPVLAERLAREVGDGDFVMFGHSMGGLLGYLVTRYFCEHGGPRPSTLAVAGFGAPQVPWHDFTVVDDDDLVRRLCELGGIPPWLAEQPDWLAPFLGFVRDDVGLCAGYQHVPQADPLPVPIRVFGGARDTLVPEAALKMWTEIAQDVEVEVLPGGHLLVSEDSGLLRESIFGLAKGSRLNV